MQYLIKPPDTSGLCLRERRRPLDLIQINPWLNMHLNNRFIARQAILNLNSHCIGYELLYRNANTDQAIFDDGCQASLQVFDSVHLFGFEVLCGESKAFVNCTGEVLTGDLINILQPARTVLEILETVIPDPDILNACARLKKSGFRLALDDFVPSDASNAFLPLADIVKVEMHTASPELVTFISEHTRTGTKLLAERVETRDEYETARALGFELFQGFYFCKPQVMATKALSPSRINNLRLLQATVNEKLEFSELETIIKQDAALCYRLLRFINSAEFCLCSSVQSIRHAFALLGERNTRRWALLTSAVMMGDGKPRELLRCALLRAKLMELIAPRARCSEYEGFLVGLLSLMAVILDSPEITTRLEVPVNVNAALVGKGGRLGDLLNVAISYERSEWERCEIAARTLKLSEAELSAAYVKAVWWVSKIPV
jgi:EAL and modified HD-GYP domain-containing signal transduction protein